MALLTLFCRLAALLVLAGSIAPGAHAQEDELGTILVSRQLAESQRLVVGNVVRLSADPGGAGAREFRIAGIYEPTPDPARLGAVPREVRLHLAELLDLTRAPDVPAGRQYVSTINVALVDPRDARGFSRDVNARMPGVFARPASGAGGSAAPFAVLERFHQAIAMVTISAATVFLLALTIMLVEERRETVVILRLIGLPARRILTQVLIEGVLVAGAGAVFGLALALASERAINWFFQWRYDTALVFVRVTLDVALDMRRHRRPARRSRHGARLVGVAPSTQSAAWLRDERTWFAFRSAFANARARPWVSSASPRSARCCSTCCCSRRVCSSRCAICSTGPVGTCA